MTQEDVNKPRLYRYFQKVHQGYTSDSIFYHHIVSRDVEHAMQQIKYHGVKLEDIISENEKV